jgi:hypothetical protein
MEMKPLRRGYADVNGVKIYHDDKRERISLGLAHL